MIAIAAVAFGLAIVPALLWCMNMFFFQEPPRITGDEKGEFPGISVLIPARNEVDRIGPALEAVRSNESVDLEILVYDDDSTDGTADLVRDHAEKDDRVRLIQGDALPDGWCGKQYACWRLAQEAENEVFCFIDADVRLSSRALPRILAELDRREVQLISGFPAQETGSFGEKLLISFIPYILLGFLPFWLMRRWNRPGFAAGCGQLMIAKREAYEAVGGHSAIRNSRHDGLTLPAAFRRNGYQTDVFDAKSIARARMYDGFRSSWNGLAKNATEGMARPGALPFFTIFLFGGQVLPLMILLITPVFQVPVPAMGLAAAAMCLAYLPRFSGVYRFDQSMISAVLHPVGVAVLLSNQWYAFLRAWIGGRAEWRGRLYDG